MPLGVLARCFLPLLAAVPPDAENPFSHAPFNLPVFRRNMMLLPADTDEQVALYDDESLDVDGDDPSGMVSAGDGFTFSQTDISKLPATCAPAFSDPSLLQANDFYGDWLWGELRRLRMLGYNVADSLKRVDLVARKTKLDDGRDDGGWNAYRTLVLTLLGRPGGIMHLVKEAMLRHRATPAEQWRDARDENRRKVDGRPLNEYEVPVPSPGMATSSLPLLDEIAELVFGLEVLNTRGAAGAMYRECAKVLANRGWEAMAGSLKRNASKSKAMCAQIDVYLKDARESKARVDLVAAVQLLTKWRTTAENTLEVGDEPFRMREKQLEVLFKTYGLAEGGQQEGETPVKRAGAGGRKAKTGSVLPSEEDVAAAQEHWNDYCRSLQRDQDCPVPIGPVRARFNLLDDKDNNDLGMKLLRNMTSEQLWASIGLAGASSFPFSAVGDDTKPAKIPRWHQIVGAVAIVMAAFTAQPGEAARSTMLCDDVGLGKTLQIIGAICIIVHMREKQEQRPDKVLPLPPFALENNTSFYAGLPQIPNRLNLAIMPRTLCTQWLEEVQGFTRHGSFHILRYSSEQPSLARYFSDPQGEYRRAAGLNNENASRVLVLAESSAIAREAARCFKAPKKLGGRAAQLLAARGDPDTLKVKEGIRLDGTIFGMQFNVVAYDESHALRNVSWMSLAAIWISERSIVRVAATATPIFTGPKDIASQGRILRHAPTIGDAGEKLHEAMHQEQRQRTKEWDKNSHYMIITNLMCEAAEIVRAAGAEDDLARRAEIEAELEKKYESPDQKSIMKTSFIMDSSISMLREAMLPIILRRTGTSTDPSGKTVLDLQPFIQVNAWCPLWENEQAALDSMNQDLLVLKSLRKKHKVEDGEKVDWSNFMNRQKHAYMHPEIMPLREQEKDRELRVGTLTNRIADKWDESNIEQAASSRLLKVDEIIAYFWVGNPTVPVYREDGTRDTAAEARLPDPKPLLSPRKFLVYVEYHLHRDMLKKVLQIRGRGLVEYDGAMSKSKREAAVLRFETEPQCRVMLITNVGAAGLNLTSASVVIFLSGVWSGQEKKQIIGRAWRYGQTAEVVVVDILAPRGLDMALAGYAGSKTVWSSTFLRSERELYQAHATITSTEHLYVPDESETDEDDQPPADVPVPKKSRVAKRKLKGDDANRTSDEDVKCRERAKQPVKKKRSKSNHVITSGAAGGPGGVVAPKVSRASDNSMPVPSTSASFSRPPPTSSVPTAPTHAPAPHAVLPSQPQPQQRRPRPQQQSSAADSSQNPGRPADLFDLSRRTEVISLGGSTSVPDAPSDPMTNTGSSAATTRPRMNRVAKPQKAPGALAYNEAEIQLAIDLDFAPARRESVPEPTRPSQKQSHHDTDGQSAGSRTSSTNVIGRTCQPTTAQPQAPSATTRSFDSSAGSSSQANHKRTGFKKRLAVPVVDTAGTSQQSARTSALDKDETRMDLSFSGPRSPSRAPKKNLFSSNA